MAPCRVVLCVARLTEGEKNEVLLRLVPYIASLYWSATIITTTGYGDILPKTKFEECTSAYFTNVVDIFRYIRHAWPIKSDSLVYCWLLAALAQTEPVRLSVRH